MRNYTFLMLLFVCLFSSSIFAGGGDLGGGSQDGSSDYPYLIEDFNDFQAFCNDSSYWDDCVRLDCDLDLDPNLPARVIYDQAPIAGNTDAYSTFDGIAFTGLFDGNSHVISNLVVNGPCYCGLFGKCDAGSEIKDLGLENANVTGSGYYLGALVGKSWQGMINNCYSTGTVTGTYLGGLVGWNEGGIIINCYSSAEVTGEVRVGGLVGWNGGESSISCCYSTGLVVGDSYVGGLVGINSGSVISCFWDKQTSGKTSSAGGIGKTTSEMQTISTFTDAGWDFIGESANGTSQIWQMPVDGGYPELTVFTDYTPVELTGDGSQADPYLINDANDLGAVVYYNRDACYELTSNIDLNSIVWTTAVIPYFKGCFDGNDHIVSNLKIDGGGSCGLFGKIGPNTIITDLGVEDVNINCSGYYVGGLVGYSYYADSISNCYCTGSVAGNYYVGSLVGGNSGNITSCYSSGLVKGSGYSIKYVGGLVGINAGNISDSYSSAEVNSLNGYVGGLLGGNNGDITSCYSTGIVTGNYRYVGGLIGENYYGDITSCYSTAEVDGEDYVGGLVGWNYRGNLTSCYNKNTVNGNRTVGGLVGYNDCYSRITSCYSKGKVTGSSSSVGGLVGSNSDHSSVIRCYSKAEVTGDSRVGGLLGSNNNSTVTICYSTGSVTGSTNVGGLVGENRGGSLYRSFWDIDSSGMTTGYNRYTYFPGTVSNVVGKTTTEMQTKSTFTSDPASWDFVGEETNGSDDIWDICDGMNYPKLIWQIPMIGDFVCGDGVDMIDFAVLADTWNLLTGQDGYNDICDLEDDGVINFDDFIIFADNWLLGL